MIHRVAYLKMCKCGEHGRIVLPDETTGAEFCSKQDGRVELDRLLRAKLIMKDELPFLNDQLSAQGGLAPTPKYADLTAYLVCSIHNHTKAEGDEPNDDKDSDGITATHTDKYLM